MTQLVKPDRSVSKDGIITLSDSNEEFRIDPGRIAVGDIDGAGRPDAVVPVFTFRNGNVTWIQHLVMLSTGRDYRIVKTFSDMLRVISLENRVLTAEISTVSPDAPGFGCSECKVVLRYVYRDGEIVKAD